MHILSPGYQIDMLKIAPVAMLPEDSIGLPVDDDVRFPVKVVTSIQMEEALEITMGSGISSAGLKVFTAAL